jgi:hypothetical protein
MTDMKELYKLADDSRVLGALQELEILRRSQMQPAVKYLGNSIDDQWKHLNSEIAETCHELREYYDLTNIDSENSKIIKGKAIMEIIDIQFSCQTMLEGALGLSKYQIADYVQMVVKKNADRGYDKK